MILTIQTRSGRELVPGGVTVDEQVRYNASMPTALMLDPRNASLSGVICALCHAST